MPSLPNVAEPDIDVESVYRIRAALFSLIQQGVVDSSVLKYLFRGDKAIADEAILWDFKAELPQLPRGVNVSDSRHRLHDYKMHEIVKDAVSFYNSYGGYLIAGVDDTDRVVRGYSGMFDTHELNEKIQGVTGHNVECIYRLVHHDIGPKQIPVGLLFIPRRSPTLPPAQFRRDSPRNDYNKYAYRGGEFYIRERDNSKPASKPDEFEFLFSDVRRSIFVAIQSSKTLLENNLPPREAELVKFIGREEELTKLWSWLVDAFDPIKLISGLGGLGKTSLAYTFAERFVYQAPRPFEKLIWLGAKTHTFRATRNAYIDTARVDFSRIDEFLCGLLSETGCPDSDISRTKGLIELKELTLDHLQTYRYLLVVDDIDTLSDNDQQELYQLIFQLCAKADAKAIITARRNLGLPEGHFSQIKGLLEPDFRAFVAERAHALGVSVPSPQVMSNLMHTTGGSPLFALSILRLVSTGDRFDRAIGKWRGADGEKVRDAAFSREVGRLKDIEVRTLAAAVYLGPTSKVELASVLHLSEFEIQEAVDTLRQFSMIVADSNLPGGATLIIPDAIASMVTIVEQRVSDYETIKDRCARQRKITADPEPHVRDAFRRTVAFLKAGDNENALKTAEAVLTLLPENRDLLYLLGRCQLESEPILAVEAENSFQKAYDRGCRRRDLFEMWLKLRGMREDWIGVIKLSQLGEAEPGVIGRFAVVRAQAHRNVCERHIRGNQYEDAAKAYVEGIEHMKAVLQKDIEDYIRPEVQDAQRKLLRGWLGVTKRISDEIRRPRRYFRATATGALTYSFFDRNALLSGLEAFASTISSVKSKSRITSLDLNQLKVDFNMLGKVLAVMQSRQLQPKLIFEISQIRDHLEEEIFNLEITQFVLAKT
jgi:hypothetical protein